jgi:poly(3-hydroxybutyrate) depolymerase
MVGVANQRHNRQKAQQAPIARKPVIAMPIRGCPNAIRHCIGSFAVAIAMAALAAADGRADDTITITHQGVERTAVLHQAGGAAGPAPLVIALQGPR